MLTVNHLQNKLQKHIKKKYIKICIYVKIVISLRRQTIRTSNNIKHINSMKALELKDLKAGNIYKESSETSTVYVEILSEGRKGNCNYIVITYEEGEVLTFSVKRKHPIFAIERYNEGYTPCTQKEFKAALKMIKDSLTL